MKKEMIKSAFHLLAGIIGFYYAYLLFVSGRQEFSFFFFITGALFMLVAATSKDVKKGFLFNGGIFFLVEGLLILLVSRDFFAGKRYMPGYLFVAIALWYIVMAATCIRRAK